MVLHVLRGLFILLMAAVGWFYLRLTGGAMGVALVLGVLFVCMDVFSSRKKLFVLSGTLLGLIVGLVVAYGMHFAVDLIVDQLSFAGMSYKSAEQNRMLSQFITFVIGLISCYLAISFTLQTKDDFRFIIPYIEFTRKTRGERPMLIDTSVLIDGRIVDVVGTGFIQCQLVVPRFVINELQTVADSGDKLKRNRGRRGLDVLAKLRESPEGEIVLYDANPREGAANAGVDQQLMDLAIELDGRVLTNDFNLNKVADLRGVDVVNLNDLGRALRPVVLPGEKMVVRLIKPGESAGQGIGYLDDGTMVVVEQGRAHLNEDVELTITKSLQTSAGRMIFGRIGEIAEDHHPERPAGAARRLSQQTRTAQEI